MVLSVFPRFALCAILGSASDVAPVAHFSVWPQPAKFNFDQSSVIRLSTKDFTFRSQLQQALGHTTEDASLMEDAFKRYNKFIFAGAELDPEHDSLPVLRELTVSVALGNVPLQLGVDESYRLSVSGVTPKAHLAAETVWGALLGLETFAQLVSEDLLLGGNISVVDAPRFPWRGLLVDTGRHFLPVRVLKRTIDGIAAQKMNVLHWHVSDAQSFPLRSKAFPRLAEQGSYRYPQATYSAKTVSRVVEYARQRGVRVVLELGTPGHTASWGLGHPELVVSCPQFKSTFGFTAKMDCIPLDISQDFTYEVVEGLFRETAAYAPDGFMHLGGDEVQYGCWNESQNMRNWMKKKGFDDYAQAESFWISSTVRMAQRQGQRRAVVWQESFDNAQQFEDPALQLPKDAVVQFWSNRATLPDALSKGYDVIMSEGWYLDLAQPGIRRGRRQDSWMDFYNTNATDGAEDIDPDLVAKHLLGGEAGMWGEEIDETNLETSVFPRSSAVAEKLYTALDQIGTDVNKDGNPSIGQLQLASKVTQRLETFRCVLWRRGIRAGPVAWPSYCAGKPRRKPTTVSLFDSAWYGELADS